MIGATLGAVIGVTVALFTTGIWPTTVLVAAFFIAYQQFENYLIAPRVLKTTVELGAAAVLIAGLIGAAVLGLVGALMAIPVAAAFNVLLNERLIAHETAAGVALPNAAEAAGAPPAADAAPAPEAGAEVRGSGPPDRG
jgi:predicted PurR-regulated permease PerM